MSTKLLSPEDLTERAPGTLPNYWAKLRCTGEGPEFVKIGRRIFYEEPKFEEWLAKKRRVSTSDNGKVPEAEKCA